MGNNLRQMPRSRSRYVSSYRSASSCVRFAKAFLLTTRRVVGYVVIRLNVDRRSVEADRAARQRAAAVGEVFVRAELQVAECIASADVHAAIFDRERRGRIGRLVQVPARRLAIGATVADEQRLDAAAAADH